MEPDENRSEDPERSGWISDEEYLNIHGVPRQDSYTCVSCLKTAYPTSDSIDLFDLDAAHIEFIDGRKSPVIVCFECIESDDWEERARAHLVTDQSSRRPSTPRARLRAFLTTLWSTPAEPPSLLAEQWLFVRRAALVLSVLVVSTLGLVLFTGLSMWLLTTPAAGSAWVTGAAQTILTAVIGLTRRPTILVGVAGLAYFAHLKSLYGPRPPTADTTTSRPRWHYLALFSAVGTIGGLAWVAIDAGVLLAATLPIALLLWTGGSIGLVYTLHATLVEDRGSYGLRYDPARWKFPVQFGVALTVLDGLVGLPWPPAIAYSIAGLPSVVGLLYVGRRYRSFSPAPVPGLPRLSRVGGILGFGPTVRPESAPAPTGGSSSRKPTETIAAYEADIDRLTAQLERIRAARPDRPATVRFADLFRLKEDLDRAVAADESLRTGVESIAHQLDELLAREGIDPIETTGPADPLEHKIVATVSAPEQPPGEIVEVYRPGFRLGDRVLQEAHVVVAADPNEP